MTASRTHPGRLFLLLGDQLDPDAGWLADFDPARDAVWMAEAVGEATRVWSHKARIALFLAAMRHCRDALRSRGWTVHYRDLDAGHQDLADALVDDIGALAPARVVGCRPGEHGVMVALAASCAQAGVELAWREDDHFLVDPGEFADWARGRRSLVMEHFYRWQRRRLGILVDAAGVPEGGRWNYDADNRRSFGREGPGLLPAPLAFPPDALTREVLEEVARRFPDHPGELAGFDWPVTRAQAAQALDDFVRHRLAAFGPYQDALWQGEPWLYHARLSAAMNLKLLDPRTVVDAALAAWREGSAPLASVEGFVRQVIGWREYVRGIYWLRMPDYVGLNGLGADADLPAFYWTGDTDMACLRDALGQLLRHGYNHHIQRLMLTGLFALLLGVRPQQVHEWFLAMHVDAVEWVELPNTLGMGQHADGGLLGSKPYVASGRYIERMGNHCRDCRYRPGTALGEDACPFTTLYWDFLDRHRGRFGKHPRTALQWRSLDRMDPDARAAIRIAAVQLRASLAPRGSAQTGDAR
ncbi:MAG: cryptochrome/photolyase family protein [Xanthomonadales bacterium]|nr:cryptochrome/photolyase family protein [Xanthomonadales bacterium]